MFNNGYIKRESTLTWFHILLPLFNKIIKTINKIKEKNKNQSKSTVKIKNKVINVKTYTIATIYVISKTW